MVIQENSFIRHQNIAVPDSAGAGWIALTETERNEYSFGSRSLLNSLHFRSIYWNRVCDHLAEERVILNRSPQSRPNRETGKKRFRKRNELSSLPRCFVDQITHLVNSGSTVEVDGSSV